jgi:hypothetical protein
MVHLWATLLVGLASPVVIPADAVCARRDALLTALAHRYREQPKALGLSSSGVVIELMTSGEGKTWTLLLTQPDGTSCIIATGEAWQPAPQELAGQPL